MRAVPPLAVFVCALACAHPRGSDRARADLAAGGMVAVSGGRFRLVHGSGPFSDVPTWVSVRPFLLDATEVTVAAYGACVQAGRCAPAAAKPGGGGRPRKTKVWSSCNADRADRAGHPVNCVEWGQAVAYCAWAGKRLPTEEEWEWAARNGRGATPYPWGDAAPGVRPCWSGAAPRTGGAGGEPPAGTCPAGGSDGDVSAAGVKDLAGNVSEWTASQTVVGTDSVGRGGTPVKVLRGGAWPDLDAAAVSVAARAAELPDLRDARLGFRCASAP